LYALSYQALLAVASYLDYNFVFASWLTVSLLWCEFTLQ